MTDSKKKAKKTYSLRDLDSEADPFFFVKDFDNLSLDIDSAKESEEPRRTRNGDLRCNMYQRMFRREEEDLNDMEIFEAFEKKVEHYNQVVIKDSGLTRELIRGQVRRQIKEPLEIGVDSERQFLEMVREREAQAEEYRRRRERVPVGGGDSSFWERKHSDRKKDAKNKKSKKIKKKKKKSRKNGKKKSKKNDTDHLEQTALKEDEKQFPLLENCTLLDKICLKKQFFNLLNKILNFNFTIKHCLVKVKDSEGGDGHTQVGVIRRIISISSRPYSLNNVKETRYLVVYFSENRAKIKVPFSGMEDAPLTPADLESVTKNLQDFPDKKLDFAWFYLKLNQLKEIAGDSNTNYYMDSFIQRTIRSNGNLSNFEIREILQQRFNHLEYWNKLAFSFLRFEKLRNLRAQLERVGRDLQNDRLPWIYFRVKRRRSVQFHEHHQEILQAIEEGKSFKEFKKKFQAKQAMKPETKKFRKIKEDLKIKYKSKKNELKAEYLFVEQSEEEDDSGLVEEFMGRSRVYDYQLTKFKENFQKLRAVGKTVQSWDLLNYRIKLKPKVF